MKTAKMKFFIVALAVVMFPAMAFAQEMAFISPLTLGLKLTETVQVLAAKDEGGKTIKPKELVWDNEWETNKGAYFELVAKMQITRIGNKELLEWLADAGVIDAVKGSKLVLIFGDGVEVAVEESDGELVFLGDIIDFSPMMDVQVIDLKVEGEETDKHAKFSQNIQIKSPIQIMFELEGRESMMLGIMDMSLAMNAIESENKDEETFSFNGGEVNPIGGLLFDNNTDNATECFEEGCVGIVDGRIKVSKGKEFFFED